AVLRWWSISPFHSDPAVIWRSCQPRITPCLWSRAKAFTSFSRSRTSLWEYEKKTSMGSGGVGGAAIVSDSLLSETRRETSHGWAPRPGPSIVRADFDHE